MDRRDFLKSFALLTGSVAFGVSTEKSDIDYLIPYDHAKDFLDEYGDGLGYGGSLDGFWDEGGDAVPQENDPIFLSLRDVTVNENYIVALSPTFEKKWREAHDECVVVKPAAKEDRIKIFRRHLYGDV